MPGNRCQATAKISLLDLSANHVLPVLLPPKLVLRFSGLSDSNAVHSTDIYTVPTICQTLFKLLDPSNQEMKTKNPALELNSSGTTDDKQ